jgi:hypothetical protein
MPRASLLRELEPLTHGERVQTMLALGREAVNDSSIRDLIRELERGDFFERYVALCSCPGSRDGAHILRAVDDPSRTIRGRAIELIPTICDDDQALVAFDRLRPDGRRHLAMRLAELGRFAPVDALVERLAVEGDRQLAAILTYASDAVLTRHLPRIASSFDGVDWRRLARRHPQLAVQTLRQVVEGRAEIDERLITSINEVLPFLGERLPDEALALARLLAPQVSLSHLALDQLIHKRPVETVRLALDLGDVTGLRLDAVAPRLEPDQLVALVRRGALSSLRLKTLVPLLTAPQVGRIFAEVGDGLRDTLLGELISPDLIARLPPDERLAVARSHLDLPILQTRPTQRVTYAAYLPWPDAWGYLNPLLDDPDADLRAAALVALATATRYAPEHLDTLLEVANAHQNEPDPVRLQLVGAIAALPPSRWMPKHLDDLGQVIAAAVEATDLSHPTGSATIRLIAKVARYHPDWSARWLAQVLRRRGQWFDPARGSVHERIGALSSWFDDATAARLSAALRPILEEWATDYQGIGALLQLMRSFSHRLRAFDSLDDVLQRALLGPSEPKSVDILLDHLGRFRPERFVAFVPEILAQDRSWITRPQVSSFVQHQRQDLLTPYLSAPVLRGRFGTGKSRFILPSFRHFQRWSARQQRRYSLTLTRIAAEPRTDVKTTQSLLRQYAALPAASITPLVDLSHDERPATREIAIKALGRRDADDGVPELIAALGDERGRFAVYALRRAILRLSPDQALALLQKAPMNQVSVAKEVVRLLGEVRASTSFRDLLALYDQPLHRDVRVALLRALWNFPEEAESWRIFAEAAASDDRHLASVVVRIPVDGLSDLAYGRLISILATLLRHPDPLVRQAALERCAERPVDDPEKRLLAAMLDLVASLLPDERIVAAAAVAMVYGRHDPALVGTAVRRFRDDRRALQALVDGLASAVLELPVSSRKGRIPRRSIQRLRAQLGASVYYLQVTGRVRSIRRPLLVPVARAMIAALRDDPLTAGLRATLMARILPWSEVGDELTAMAAAHTLFPDTLEKAANGFGWVVHRPDREGLLELGARLRESDDPRLRRLGLAALVAFSQPPGAWTPETIALLAAYRVDPSPEVAGPAQFTFLPEERGLPGPAQPSRPRRG